jgi:hypothetical protein
MTLPEHDVASRIIELGRSAQEANESSAWQSVADELDRIARQIRETLASNNQEPSPAVAKISTMCNPKLAAILKAKAQTEGKPPSRLVAEAVRNFVVQPPADGSPIWHARLSVVRSLMGRDTLTAAVDSTTKQVFESMLPKVVGVTNKSQLLAWVVWHFLGCPSDRT